MNKNQKNILIVVALGFVMAFLFPPHAFFREGGSAIKMGYSFIANIPYQQSIHISMLFAEWLGISIIGVIFYFIARDTKQEYTLLHCNSGVQSENLYKNSLPKDPLRKILSFPNILFLFLYLIALMQLTAHYPEYPLHLLMARALGFCLIPFVAGVYYNFSNNESSISKYFYVATIVIILVIISGSAAQNRKESEIISGESGYASTPQSQAYSPQTEQAQASPIQSQTVTHPPITNNHKEIFQRAGNLYKQGKYAEAAPLFRQVAEQGHSGAQAILGEMYINGQGVTQDYNQAAYFMIKAAEQGQAAAQYCLGTMYLLGQGVTQDYAQSEYWMRKSAEQGNQIGQIKIGLMYELGKGVIQDYNQAVYWYYKAAEQNNEFAQVSLGNMYIEGKGVAQDFNQAIYWYKKAADQGSVEASNKLKDLNALLEPTVTETPDKFTINTNDHRIFEIKGDLKNIKKQMKESNLNSGYQYE